MWTQLVQPNLTIVGKVGYCLQYARQVFSAPAVEPTAWKAWQAAKYKHLDQNFPPVAIPVWFNYYQNGVQYGHVAVRLGNGQIYSSPWKSGTPYAVLKSIKEVEQIYNATYVGWSEDISNVRVAIGEDNMETTKVDHGALNMLFPAFTGFPPTPAQSKAFIGKYWADVVHTLETSEAHKKHVAEVAMYREAWVTLNDGFKEITAYVKK